MIVGALHNNFPVGIRSRLLQIKGTMAEMCKTRPPFSHLWRESNTIKVNSLSCVMLKSTRQFVLSFTI